MEIGIGSTLGDYQVVGILGAGGMGKVYKVRNVISDRIEAMKVLLPDLAATPELADRFLREIKLLASLDHPHIAQLHTAVRDGNQLLMVMEFVDGETLEHRLKSGPLPLPEALDSIGQVLAALDFAHSRGVIHRDIKPANMMFTKSGVVKLMDFGIAKGAADRKLTMTGMTVGSVYYMSPEQIQGVANVDGRADLYSVGITLYELVTGKRPFDGESQYAIMAAHLEKSPVPPITLDPRLPQALNDAILMAVAKDPNARFQTAAAFRNALMGVAATLQAPTTSVAAAPAPAASAPTSRRWLWMAAGGLAAALAIVGAIEFAPWKATRAAGPAKVQVQSAAAVPAPVTAAPQTTPLAAPAEQQAAPVAQAAITKPVRRASEPVSTPPTAPPPQQPATVQQQPVVSAPAVAPPQQSAVPTPQAPAPPGPSPAVILQAREHFAKLQVRAGAIDDSLANLKRSMQAQGAGLNARFTQPQGLMENYLQSSQNALNQGDLAAAREYADKAERQIEILEKLLNM